LDENGNKIDEKTNKKPKKPRMKIDANYLIDNPVGMKNLYRKVIIDKEKNLNFKGQGHELRDFNKLMNVYKNWHFEVMPKFEFTYFAERMQKAGTDKAMKAFMSTMRKVYKGDLMTD